jgi:hypothetical protein
LADAVRQPNVAARLLNAAEYLENIARRHPDETRPPIGGAALAGREQEGRQ